MSERAQQLVLADRFIKTMDENKDYHLVLFIALTKWIEKQNMWHLAEGYGKAFTQLTEELKEKEKNVDVQN